MTCPASAAENQFDALPIRIEISDDFGRFLSFAPHLFAKALLSQVETALDADASYNTLLARSQAGLQMALMNDRVVQEAQTAVARRQQMTGMPTPTFR